MLESRFRNPVNGLYLSGLFFETAQQGHRGNMLYTLKNWDHTVDGVVYPSLYLRYLETNDPTEYRFATTWLEGWYHWERLTECLWFKPYHEAWKKELLLRLQSNALARIVAESKTTTKDAFTANRYLLEKGWEARGQASHGRGRPSKEEVKKAAYDLASSEKQLSEDFARISASAPSTLRN